MGFRLKILAALMLSLSFGLSQPSHAQTANPPDSNCRDDHGKDRCDDAAVSAQNTLFGVEPISDFVEKGAYVRRAFYVDGYGRDLLAISFIRAPGAEPRVEVRTAGREGKQPSVLSAPLSEELWNEAVARGRYFDRKLEKLPQDPDAISICLHAWVMRVEAGDPARQSQNILGKSILPSQVKAVTQDSCGNSLSGDYAFDLANIALRALPNCALISEVRQRNVVTRLATCAGFRGDRVAAAHAWNRFATMQTLVEPGQNDAALFNQSWRGAFSPDADVMVDGKSFGVKGYKNLDPLMAWTAPYRIARIYPESFSGIDADTVEMRGTFSGYRKDAGDNDLPETAPVTIRWTRFGGDFGIGVMTIGKVSHTKSAQGTEN